MIKAVIDTNVLISGIIFPKASSVKIINLWQKQTFVLVISRPILQELRRVLSYPKIAKTYHLDKEKIDELLMGFSVFSEVCSPKEKILIIRQDPGDNKFLGAALSARADFIASGDKHLLALGEYDILPALKRRVSTLKRGCRLASIHPRNELRGFLEVANKGIEILTPAEFLRRLRKTKE